MDYQWTKDEQEQFRALQDSGCGWPQIASRTVELMAARGGTMTAERLADLKKGGLSSDEVDEFWQHVAAQGADNMRLMTECLGLQAVNKELGARVAALEACVKEMENQIATERRADAQLRRDLGATESETLRGACLRVVKERDTLAGLHREALACVKKMRSERDGDRAELAATRATLRHEVEHRRTMEDELARLKPSGQVAEDEETVRMGIGDVHDNECASLERHGDACDCPNSEGEHAALSRLAALAQQGQEMRERATDEQGREAAYSGLAHPINVATAVAQWIVEGVGPSETQDAGAGHEGCPDSPCPGHHPYCEGVGKDAEPPPVPGHPERIAQQSKAFSEAVKWKPRDAEDETAWEEGRTTGYTEGAEAMRAACLETLDEWARKEGHASSPLVVIIRGLIEGAAP